MRAVPRRRLEALVGLLVPPACREPVLGDLHERYKSTGGYLLDAARTVPHVIASQVRRTTDRRFALVAALALYAAFVAAGRLFEGERFLYEQPGFLRLAIPAAAALAGLALGGAYAGVQRGSLREWIGTAVLTAAFAFLSQGLVAAVQPEWVLPPWVLLSGTAASVFMTPVRWMLARADEKKLREAPLGGGLAPREEIPGRARAFETKIRRRNRREFLAAGLVTVIFGVYIATIANPTMRLGSALIIAGTIYVMHRLHRRGSARPVPEDAEFKDCLDFYRAELARQRDLLRGVWLWYIGPLVPGLAVFAFGTMQAHQDRSGSIANAALAALALLAIVVLNRWGAGKLQREIDELNALEKQ